MLLFFFKSYWLVGLDPLCIISLIGQSVSLGELVGVVMLFLLFQSHLIGLYYKELWDMIAKGC